MNAVQFRCVRSGNTVSFTNENDIAGMRKHEGYVEVTDATPVVQKTPELPSFLQNADVPVVKKRGRPSKQEV